MSFFDDIGLRAAEQLETSVGPYVALASYKRLLAGPADVRARALVGALRCAIALDDDREIQAAASALAGAPANVLAPSAVPFAIELLLKGKTELAVHVAQTEIERTKDPLAAYVRARALEASALGGVDAVALWAEVAERGNGPEIHVAVRAQATARYVAACLQRARKDATFELPRARLAGLAESAKLEPLGSEQRLLVLRGRLLSGSNFHRASALSAVEEIARKSAEPARRMAIDLAARHFDEMPFHLHAIEIDRVRATIRRHPNEALRARLEQRLDATLALLKAHGTGNPVKVDEALDGLIRTSESVRAALARIRASEKGGDAAGALLSTTPYDELAGLGVTAIVELRKQPTSLSSSAQTCLDRARDLLSPDVAVPLPLWTAAREALSRRGPLAESGAALIAAAFSRTTSFAPPKLVDLAASLGRVGSHDAAALVLAEATRMREPEARAASADHHRRVAYEALARGDRDAAWRALTTARELFG